MYEFSALWTFIASDGSSVSFNDGGLLICEEVTGFDSPNVRENLEDLPEADGASVGDFFYGSRPVTFSGVLTGAPDQRNLAAVQLQAATRGLRGNVTIRSQATGLPAMEAYGRVQNLRLTRREGIAKSFQIGMVCADPRIYSQTLNTVAETGVAATGGAPFPLAFPINFGGGSGATVTASITNAGNFSSPILLRVSGPIDGPYVRNATTNKTIYIDNVSLITGEYLDIDTAARTVVKSDATNLYSKVRIPASEWWYLQPGTNVLELRATSAPSTSTLTSWWRDAWC